MPKIIHPLSTYLHLPKQSLQGMSNIQLIIEERAADIGKFLVGRLLPFRQKRSVGPFVFIDHMGPASLDASSNFDVAPHPHIGLSTLTFLFEGSILHRDSVGSSIEINPGAVNWMTAGKGVVHSERTPERLRGRSKSIHGLQIWVALPKELEECEPSFQHVAAEEIPTFSLGTIHCKLIAGACFGHKSPVQVYSPLYFLELSSTSQETVDLGSELFGESALYILQGSIEADGEVYGTKQLLVAKENTLCSFTIKENTRLYIFGGTPFPEERFIFWNFVSSDKNRIEKAKKDWTEQTFPKIDGETEFVPLPEFKLK
jgi:redox-sensitive bicupin YhaK (pirin superfamily)